MPLQGFQHQATSTKETLGTFLIKKWDFKEPIFNHYRELFKKKGPHYLNLTTYWEAIRKNIQFYFSSTKFLFYKFKFSKLKKFMFSKLKKKGPEENLEPFLTKIKRTLKRPPIKKKTVRTCWEPCSRGISWSKLDKP